VFYTEFEIRTYYNVFQFCNTFHCSESFNSNWNPCWQLPHLWSYIHRSINLISKITLLWHQACPRLLPLVATLLQTIINLLQIDEVSSINKAHVLFMQMAIEIVIPFSRNVYISAEFCGKAEPVYFINYNMFWISLIDCWKCITFLNIQLRYSLSNLIVYQDKCENFFKRPYCK
jgi:hypothetical protein